MLKFDYKLFHITGCDTNGYFLTIYKYFYNN